MLKKASLYGISLSLLSSISVLSSANVVINGTRIIYPSNEKEITVNLTNKGKAPVLAQSWIDSGDVDAKPEQIVVPFVLTPPINRIDPEKSQTLRLSYTASPALAEDRETVYWLNVLEIPAVSKNAADNRLQVAFRSRIKLFYRPSSLNDSAKTIQAAESLTWSYSGNSLTAQNNSPYHISLTSIDLKQGATKATTEADMISPFAHRSFSVKNSALLRAGTEVSYQYINDWGAVKTVTTKLQ